MQIRMENGSRVAIISVNMSGGPFSVRLYLNYGETATCQGDRAKTLKGAQGIARRLLAL